MTRYIITRNYKRYFYDIYNFCDRAIDDILESRNKPVNLIENMSLEWFDNHACLLYKLFKEAYPSVIIIYDNNKVVSIACVEELNKHTLMILKRLYILREYTLKPLLSGIMLPEQVKWAKEHNYERVIFSINKYNKTLIKLVNRIIEGKGITIKHSNILKKFRFVGIETIHHTEQYTYEYILD